MKSFGVIADFLSFDFIGRFFGISWVNLGTDLDGLSRSFCCSSVGWALSLAGDARWVRVATAFRLDASLAFPSPLFSSLVLSTLAGNLSLEGDTFTGVMFRDLAGLPRRASGDLVFGDLSIRFTPASPRQVSGVPALARAAFLHGVVNLFTGVNV